MVNLKGEGGRGSLYWDMVCLGDVVVCYVWYLTHDLTRRADVGMVHMLGGVTGRSSVLFREVLFTAVIGVMVPLKMIF